MAYDTYENFKTAVYNALDVSSTDLTGVVDDIIADAERRIWDDLRVPEMESAYSQAVSSGVTTVPSGFIEWKYAYADTNPVTWLESRPASWVIEQYPTRSSDGTPHFIAEDAGNFIFGPFPDSAYAIKGTYYQQTTSIATTGTVQGLFQAYPDLFKFAVCTEAEIALKRPDQVQLWDARYQATRDRINDRAKSRQFGGQLAVKVAY